MCSPLVEEGSVVVREDWFQARQTMDEDVVGGSEGQQTRQV